jgi:hypothetical protein
MDEIEKENERLVITGYIVILNLLTIIIFPLKYSFGYFVRVDKQKEMTLFSLLVVFSNIYFDPPIADEMDVVIQQHQSEQPI